MTPTADRTKSQKGWIIFTLEQNRLLEYKRLQRPERRRLLNKRWGILSMAILLTLSFLKLPAAQAQFSGEGSTSSGDRSLSLFSTDTLSNSRNAWGLSIGASQFYTSNLYHSGVPPLPLRVTAISPVVYANASRRHTRFHVDYGYSYRIANGHRELNSSEHFGNMSLSHQLSRRIEIRLADRTTYTSDDTFYNLFNNSSAGPVEQGSSSDLHFELLQSRQRILRNYAKVEISFQIGRNTSLSFYGAHILYRYSNIEEYNTSAVQVGGSFEHQLNKWVSFTSAYSEYLNTVDRRLQDSRIQRIEAGGLNFRLSDSWSCFASGGAEYADSQGLRHFRSSARGGLSRSSRRNVLSINYQRGFNSAIGTDKIFPSQSLKVEMVQELTRAARIQLAGLYVRSEDFISPGKLDSRSASARIEWTLRPDIIMSANYNYQNQKNAIDELSDVLNINRSTVYVGMQYQWPSFKR